MCEGALSRLWFDPHSQKAVPVIVAQEEEEDEILEEEGAVSETEVEEVVAEN